MTSARRATPAAAAAAVTTPRQAPLDPSSLVVAAIAVLAIAVYVVVALARMRFPFELEWMEGASIAHLDRVAHGLPLYVKPSLEFTPFIYPPFYFTVASWMAKVTGVGFLPLRIVSFASSLGCFALLYAAVRPESGSRVPALLAAGLFAAAYRQSGSWLDLGRVDTLFLMLLLGGYVALRRIGAPWVSGILAGVLVALSFFTKQAALFVAAPVALAVLVTDVRRGIAFAATLGLVIGIGVLWLDHATGGWFRVYVFDLPRHHPIIPQLLRGYWIDDLLGPFGIALMLGTLHFVAAAPEGSRRRRRVLDAVFVVALIGTAYATRVRVGSFINVTLPGVLGVCLMFGLGIAALTRLSGRGTTPALRIERLVALLVLVQFALLAYSPAGQIPSKGDVEAGRQIVESLRRVNGEVWVPRHDYLAVMAGKPWHAHELALQDVLRQGDSPRQRELLGELQRAAAERRFAVIVLDDETWIHDMIQPTYALLARMFRDDEKKLFWPKTGFVTRPDFVWTPRPDSSSVATGSRPRP